MDAKIKQAMFNLKDELDMFAEDSIMITVQRKDLELAVKGLFFKGDEWSNLAALGYAIAAAEKAGMEDYEITVLVNEMKRQFDDVTLEKAAEHYRESNY